MSNLMRMGAEFLSEKRHDHTTESVTYKRGAFSVDLSATIGSTDSLDNQVEGVVVDTDRVDFIIRVADLVIDGSNTLPRDGDEIVFTNGDETRTYQVKPDDQDECYRDCDEFGFDIRVHTTRLEVA